MKPNATSKPLFSVAQLQAALAAASAGVAGQRGSWAQAVATQGGGVEATLAQLRRARGPQKAPTKVPTTIRFDADVLAALKSGGKGWQTRVNDAMRDWLKQHNASTGTTGVEVGR